ncbi:MAG: GDYXXLXY domain-containing protein [Flavobacteriales bacterium]
MRKGLLLFALIALAQWAVPIWMVRSKEHVLSKGTEYKFKLQPIDPYDPFRGEYVTLNFETFNNPIPLLDTVAMDGQYRGYALLGTGDDGFARAIGLSAAEPEAGDYVRITSYTYTVYDTSGMKSIPDLVNGVEPEFNRFYMQEGGGHVAEDLVRWRPDTAALREAYALVRVYKGDAVVEDLIIGGRSVHAWIDEAKAAADTATAY